jgi:hypothetical protein
MEFQVNKVGALPVIFVKPSPSAQARTAARSSGKSGLSVTFRLAGGNPNPGCFSRTWQLSLLYHFTSPPWTMAQTGIWISQ